MLFRGTQDAPGAAPGAAAEGGVEGLAGIGATIRRPLILIALIALVITAASVLYYVTYESRRRAYFIDQYTREVSLLAQRVSLSVNGLTEAVRNASAENDAPAPRTKGRAVKHGAAPSPIPTPGAQARRIQLIDGMTRLEGPELNRALFALSQDRSGSPIALPETRRAHESATLPGPLAADAGSLLTRDSMLAFCFGICAKYRLSDIVNTAIAESILADVEIVLLADNGDVLLHRGQSGVTILSMPTDAKQVVVALGDKSQRTVKLPAFDEVRFASGSSEVEIAGSTYHAMTAPVRVETFIDVMRKPGDSESVRNAIQAGGRTWVVAAIVPDAVLGKQAAAVSSAVVAMLPMILLISLLLLPLVKVITLGPTEALHWWDVHLVAVAGVLLTAVVVIAFSAVLAYRSLQLQLDERIRQVAMGVSANFKDELEASAQAAGRVRRILASRYGDSWPDKERRRTCTRMFDEVTCHFQDGTKAPKPSPAIEAIRRRYPDLEQLIVADSNGEQIEKWTPLNQTTRPIALRDFKFFRDARDGRLVYLDGDKASTPAVAFNVLRSQNTSKDLAAVSVPMARGDGSNWVVTIVTPMVSLKDPLLSAGVEFAVVDAEGQVLFHSRESRRLSEWFFRELQGSRHLEAAVRNQRSEIASARYRGRTYRMATTPVPETQWNVIVFSETETIRVGVLDAAMSAFGVSLFYIGFYLLIALGFALLKRSEHGWWLWPHWDRLRAYAATSTCLAAIGIWFGVATWRAESGWMFSVALCVSIYVHIIVRFSTRRHSGPLRFGDMATLLLLIVAGAAIWVLACTRADAPWVALSWIGVASGTVVLALVGRNPTSWRPAAYSYELMLGSLLVVLAALPAATFFDGSMRAAIGALVRSEQASMIAAETARIEAAESRAERHGIRDGKPPRMIDGAWDVVRPGADVHSCQLARPRDRGQPVKPAESTAKLPWISGFAETVMGSVPAFNDEAFRLRAALYEAEDRDYHPHGDFEASLAAADPGYGAAAERLRDSASARVNGGRGVEVTTPVPIWTCLFWRVLPGFVSTGGVPAVCRRVPVDPKAERDWERTNARASWTIAVWLFAALLVAIVFPLGIRATVRGVFGKAKRPARATRDDLQQSRGVLFIKPPAAAVQWLTAGCRYIDMRIAKEAKDVPSLLGGVRKDDSVVVDNFSHRMGNEPWDAARLDLLEELVLRRKAVVAVIAEVDPLPFMSSKIRSHPAPSDGSPDETLERWGHALAQLRKMDRYADESVPPKRSRVSMADLAEECRWTPRLRAIRDEILDDLGVDRADAGKEGTRLNLTPYRLVESVASRAAAHYRVLWSYCTEEEKLILVNLANGKMASRAGWPIVRTLADRGLVIEGPPARIMNASFREFVLTAESQVRLRAWRRQAGRGAWSEIRTGVTLVALVGGAALYFTQPDAFSRGAAFLSAVVGASGAVFNIAALMAGRRPEPKG